MRPAHRTRNPSPQGTEPEHAIEAPYLVELADPNPSRRGGLAPTLRNVWSQDRDPESLARGLAIGLFVAFLPLPAFQGLLAIAAAHLAGGNRALSAAATLVTNWLTFAPIFAGAVWVGSLILPGVSPADFVAPDFSWSFFRENSGDLLLAYATGTLLFSFASAGTGYFALKRYAERRNQRRWNRLQDGGPTEACP